MHTADRYLLGMRWRDHYFVDLVLPFGLRSAPFLFDTVSCETDSTISTTSSQLGPLTLQFARSMCRLPSRYSLASVCLST